MTATQPLTSGDLVRMLEKAYLPEGKFPAGIFAAEVMSPCGTRRADALWLPTTHYTGSGLIGHEIKVSRSDLAVELADPAKADPWAQFCSRWWLVVADPKLIDGLVIPDAWGVMAPPSGRRRTTPTVIREAPVLNPVNPAPALARLLKWQMVGTRERIQQTEWELNRGKQEIARLNQKLEDSSAVASGAFISPHTHRLNKIIAEAQRQAREIHHESESYWWGEFDDAVIVEALVDLALARHAAEEVRQTANRLMEEIERTYDPLRKAKACAAAALKAALAGEGVTV